MSSKDFEFHTDTGRLSLNWIATLGDRKGIPLERIASVEDLKRWLEDVADQTLSFEPGEHDLDQAKRLRAGVTGLVEALVAKRVPNPSDIDTLNTFASAPPVPVRLDQTGARLEGQSATNSAVLFGLIARDAIDLVTGSDFKKVKSCAAEDCSVFFVDYSRPGKRRWCSMARCGNQAKKRTFLAKEG